MTDQTEHCIYCGSDDLVLTGEQENSAPEQAFLYCRNCQAVFTGLEQRFNAYCTASPQKAAACAPEAVLKRALKLIKQSRCNAALELLSLPVCPLQRPLEFMIYRDVCQINGSLLHRSIVPHSDSYELSLLEMLDSNLRNMDYWLPAGDEDACLHILKNIHSALLHLNYASFDRKSSAAWPSVCGDCRTPPMGCSISKWLSSCCIRLSDLIVRADSIFPLAAVILWQLNCLRNS